MGIEKIGLWRARKNSDQLSTLRELAVTAIFHPTMSGADEEKPFAVHKRYADMVGNVAYEAFLQTEAASLDAVNFVVDAERKSRLRLFAPYNVQLLIADHYNAHPELQTELVERNYRAQTHLVGDSLTALCRGASESVTISTLQLLTRIEQSIALGREAHISSKNQ